MRRDRSRDSRSWRRRRVELNALSTEALVGLVEDTLTEHGVEKVVPAADDLAAAWRSARAHAEVREAIERANRKARRWAKADTPDDLADRVRAILEENPTLPWDVALRQIAEGGPPRRVSRGDAPP